MKVATRIVFKISNTFSEWAKAFDDDRANQEAAGIKAIFRGVSETDSSTVMEKVLPLVMDSWSSVNSLALPLPVMI